MHVTRISCALTMHPRASRQEGEGEGEEEGDKEGEPQEEEEEDDDEEEEGTQAPEPVPENVAKVLKQAGCKASEFQGLAGKDLKALAKKLQEVPLELLEGAFDFEDKTSSFYTQQAPDKAKNKQSGYGMRLAICLAQGIWEEEEEPKKAPQRKRARTS